MALSQLRNAERRRIPGPGRSPSPRPGFSPTWSGPAVMLLVWAIVAVVAAVDRVTGHEISLFVFYFIPISLGAWSGGRRDGLLLAFSCAVLWLLIDIATQHSYSQEWVRYWNTAIRLVAFISVAVMMSHIRMLVERDRARQAQLVNELHGLLPICSLCKRIRNDHGYWERVERYVSARSAATFTHGICPECSERHFPGPVA